MVAKIVKGQNFKGAIDYITDIYGKDKQKKGASDLSFFGNTAQCG